LSNNYLWSSFEQRNITGVFEINATFIWEQAMLYNAQGQLARTYAYPEKTTLDGLPNGVYSLEVFEEGSSVPIVISLIKK
jgi:hypothetical protein